MTIEALVIPLPSLQIPRVRAITPEQFAREHLQGAGTPVIVTDATAAWAARTRWTFEYFKTAFGDDLVCPELGLDSGIGKITRLATYLDYLDAPEGELQGFWTNISTGQPCEVPGKWRHVRPYLVDWRAFHRHPGLHEDIAPLYFTDDWTAGLSASDRESFEQTARRAYLDVLVGPAGAESELHYDFGHTHACLSQVAGIKRALLFSPEDTARATAYEGVLEPGDALFIPPDWWHHVRTIEKSITVSYNFFNAANVARHMESLERRLPEKS